MLSAGIVRLAIVPVVLIGLVAASFGYTRLTQALPVCGRDATVPTSDLGTPTQTGTTLQERLGSASDERAFRFLLTNPSGVYVYVGDQWYDLDLAVYSIELNRSVACWTTIGAKARSENAERRVLQFVRPDEQIIEALSPGVYTLLAMADRHAVEQGRGPAGFDPSRAFTIRIAASPLVCGVAPPNVAHPASGTSDLFAGLKVRPSDALYQVAMNYQPLVPDASSLMTFSVTASPPYNDLFDFQWAVNGNSVPGATDLTFQAPARNIAPSGGRGQVSVTAKGARVYPDPDQPHVPLNGGSLSVDCSVTVR